MWRPSTDGHQEGGAPAHDLREAEARVARAAGERVILPGTLVALHEVVRRAGSAPRTVFIHACNRWEVEVEKRVVGI